MDGNWERKFSSSMQGMLMEINRRYIGKCFHQMMELGIYPGQVPVLKMLAVKDGCSQKEIADFLHIKPPTVNVTVSRLERSGVLYRRQDEKDQRITRIYMTDEGKKIMKQAMEKINANEKVLFAGFTEAEMCLMQRFFQQILENIDSLPGTAENHDRKREGSDQCFDL